MVSYKVPFIMMLVAFVIQFIAWAVMFCAAVDAKKATRTLEKQIKEQCK